MNEARIVDFSKDGLSLSSLGSNKPYNLRLEKIISYLFDENVKVIIIDSEDEPPVLKQKIIQDFKNTESWKIIESKMPDSRVSDIIHRYW